MGARGLDGWSSYNWAADSETGGLMAATREMSVVDIWMSARVEIRKMARMP